ncbi:hypothetical protein NC652_008329 [Populus alba x Populus x berolinensis]|nr:hypothetical protein NC652_008329 [Populus alba x Populus x berolinensis]
MIPTSNYSYFTLSRKFQTPKNKGH